MIFTKGCMGILLLCFIHRALGSNGTTISKTTPTIPTTATPSAAFQNIDIITLAQAINIPSCESNCTQLLLAELYGLLELKDIFDQWNDMCTEYNQSTVCMERPNHCSHGDIYAIVTSGISNLCVKKEKFFDTNKDCIKPILDRAAQECDQACDMIQSIQDLSHKQSVQEAADKGGNIMTVLTELGDVCSSANCFLPCFREKMNTKCNRSGGMIVDGVLKPFYILVKFLDTASPVIKNIVDEKVPKSCNYLLRRASLDSIRKEKEKVDS